MQPASLLPKLSPPLKSLSCFRFIPLTSTLLNPFRFSLSLSPLHVQRHTQHSTITNKACHWHVQDWFGRAHIKEVYSRHWAPPSLSHISVAQLSECSSIGTVSVLRQEMRSLGLARSQDWNRNWSQRNRCGVMDGAVWIIGCSLQCRLGTWLAVGWTIWERLRILQLHTSPARTECHCSVTLPCQRSFQSNL